MTKKQGKRTSKGNLKQSSCDRYNQKDFASIQHLRSGSAAKGSYETRNWPLKKKECRISRATTANEAKHKLQTKLL